MREVLVTGGGSGIGRAIARAFADRGDCVTISGRRMDALEETDGGRGMRLVVADVTDEASVAALFDRSYDVVVANAGSGTAGKLKSMSLEDFQATLDVNLTGVFQTFREALREMRAGGRLIAIGSTASLQGQGNVTAYAASKHGVLGLVRSLAHEVARDGITCNAVCPDFVDTPLTDRSAEGAAARMGTSADEVRAQMGERNPVGRIITPEEVAAAVLYLASKEAAMVNGHALTLSGGMV